MKEYKFIKRTGAPFKDEDTEQIGKFILSCSNMKTEEILAKIVESKDHPIYKYIDWDNKIASHNWRLQQVRCIVSHIEIEIKVRGDNIPRKVRLMYSVSDGEDAKRYVNFDTAFANISFTNQIIARAKTELENWVERYRNYNEIKDVCLKIEAIIKKEFDN